MCLDTASGVFNGREDMYRQGLPMDSDPHDVLAILSLIYVLYSFINGEVEGILDDWVTGRKTLENFV